MSRRPQPLQKRMVAVIPYVYVYVYVYACVFVYVYVYDYVYVCECTVSNLLAPEWVIRWLI